MSEALASVVRSPLDGRVWCAVLPETDQWEGTMHASTSVRRCKEFATKRTAYYSELSIDDLVWRRDGLDLWSLYERES